MFSPDTPIPHAPAHNLWLGAFGFLNGPTFAKMELKTLASTIGE
jgi:hypothetical protein